MPPAEGADVRAHRPSEPSRSPLARHHGTVGSDGLAEEALQLMCCAEQAFGRYLESHLLLRQQREERAARRRLREQERCARSVRSA